MGKASYMILLATGDGALSLHDGLIAGGAVRARVGLVALGAQCVLALHSRQLNECPASTSNQNSIVPSSQRHLLHDQQAGW